MAASVINAANILPIVNPQIPPGGPRVIPISPVFGGGVTAYSVDLSQNQNLGQVAFIQGVYVDNSANSQPVYIFCQSTQQLLTFPAGSQQFVPLMAGVVPRFNIGSTGTATVPMFFYNVPIAPHTVNPGASGGGGSVTIAGPLDGGGNVKTADQNLLALISGGGLNVNVITGGGTAAKSSSLIINTQLNSSIGANSALAGASNRWYVTGIDIEASPDATIAAGANFNCHIWAVSGLTVFGEWYSHLPAASPLPFGEYKFSHDFVNPIPGDTLNDRVQAQLSVAALSAGFINVNVWGYAAP